MRGGADVPAHQMAREAEGRPPIPHSGREPKARGGGGLMGAMRRLGVPSRQFFPGTSPDVQGGIAPGMKTGTLTAQIPGRVEAAPHEHRHAEMAEGGDADDILDNLAESFKQRNDEPAIRLLKHLVVLKCERPLVSVSEVALMSPING